MKIYVQLFLTIIIITNFVCIFSSEEQVTGIIDVKQGKGVGGTWRTKVQWKAYWVKHWETRKIYVPIWKKVWTPVEVREWFPFPEPHPGWKQQ